MSARQTFCYLFIVGLLLLLSGEPAFAQEAAQPGTKHFILGTLQFFCLGLFVYYMLVILPKNAQESDHKKFIEGLKKNDEVVTTSGFLGRVVSVKPEHVTLDLGSNMKVRVLPKHVQALPQPDGAVDNDSKEAAPTAERKIKKKK